jgi:hypothetical protein
MHVFIGKSQSSHFLPMIILIIWKLSVQ